MESTIWVALIVGGFSFLGTFLNSKFTSNVRVIKLELKLDNLEKTVIKHNSVIERTYKLENKVCVMQNELDNIDYTKIRSI